MSDNNTPSPSESPTPLSPKEREQFDNLKALFAMPEVAAFLRRHLAHPIKSMDGLPRGWTGNTRAPYYKEKYALQVKPIVDRLIATGKPQLVPLSECGYTFNTLNSLLHQGWLWLIDNLDTPEEIYKTWRAKTVLSRTANGIALFIKEKSTEEPSTLSFIEISNKEDSSKWRVELQDFLDSAPPGTKKKWIDLNLSAEEQSDLDLSLSGLKETIVYVIKPNELIIAKKP